MKLFKVSMICARKRVGDPVLESLLRPREVHFGVIAKTSKKAIDIARESYDLTGVTIAAIAVSEIKEGVITAPSLMRPAKYTFDEKGGDTDNGQHRANKGSKSGGEDGVGYS